MLAIWKHVVDVWGLAVAIEWREILKEKEGTHLPMPHMFPPGGSNLRKNQENPSELHDRHYKHKSCRRVPKPQSSGLRRFQTGLHKVCVWCLYHRRIRTAQKRPYGYFICLSIYQSIQFWVKCFAQEPNNGKLGIVGFEPATFCFF